MPMLNACEDINFPKKLWCWVGRGLIHKNSIFIRFLTVAIYFINQVCVNDIENLKQFFCCSQISLITSTSTCRG